MSNFSSTAYNSKAYSQFRPSYTEELFQTIYRFHQGGYGKALDVATGTGQVTKGLANKFDQVHGIDISESQIAEAYKADNITYSVGIAEELPFEDASFDLITVAEAAHWFNTERFFKEVKRVLKPNGTLAVWGYSCAPLKAAPISPSKLGSSWGASALEILKKFYTDSGWEKFPQEFKHVVRYESPKQQESALEIPEGKMFVEMRSMEVWRFREYLKTWSSYKRYKETNPTGDLADECVEFIIQHYNPGSPLKEEDVLPLSWSQILLLASNRE
ncbi:S-adenosyl-L-methionine-dependent methyltransferase [Basidiobolus meristosporus CBS 931.73]|uniref:S-adenosyl-L-methionine-dependent methyltransferase n=1 Tax=Basidiobolus meristosporus CBS 931.73 TaxID=1314790 RepID=A0A1Y1YX48_9FUNG|nr:S-adenosyl-L-methionine-dependent methyltransferase [Basidiobolus meristosporus CBS 931.73]|eukprot:ORY02506.1 S-adenosyl-L-methionine-dependent methyltransferase [Basidiobolus meristosporus CBS 931.73]